MPNFDIRTKSSRALLPYQAAPHFHALGDGLAIGVRIGKTGAQTWIARYRLDGKQHHEPLGALHTVDDKARYAHACELARQFAAKLAGGLQLEAGTVGDACGRYVQHLENEKGPKTADVARRMLAGNVLDHTLAAVPLDRLAVAQFRAWRHGLVEARLPEDFDPDDDGAAEVLRRAKSTANRIITVCRAALNLAYKDSYVETDRAWRHEARFKGVEGKRKVLLTQAQVDALMRSAAPDMGVFIRGLWLSAFRPGELARLVVGDFDAAHGRVHIIKSKTGPRSVTLPEDAAALFRAQCKNKLPGAPIFARADGSAWESSNLWRPAFRAAVEATDIPESEDERLTCYHLRHASISHLMAAGVNITGLSELCGTSIQMLDANYAKNVASATNAQIAKARRAV